MNLEDHLGDILRKARAAAGVSLAQAASVVGLSESALRTLEREGTVDQPVNLIALARLLGLHGGKLQDIAAGWKPAARDLGAWRQLRQVATTRGGNTVNCFLIWDETSREAALFDTGWDAPPVFDLLEQNRIELRHLFLTHTHEDHVAAMTPLRQRFPDLALHTNSTAAPPRFRNQPGAVVSLGGLRIRHRDLPGHADDGAIYLVSGWPGGAPDVAIVGDTLFAGSLASGFISAETLKRGVREHLFTLPPDTLLCPGHGPVTTVAEEGTHNPFFEY